MKAQRYMGMMIKPHVSAPEGSAPGLAPGWQAECPDCGRTGWGLHASTVRAWIKGHRQANWPPCEKVA